MTSTLLAILAAAAAAAAAPRSITNTEAVHGLALLGEQVLACTEGGVDVFSTAGAWLRTLHVEDGLPAHQCRALRRVEDAVFAATDQGIVELSVTGQTIVITRIGPQTWQALPDEATRVAMVGRIAQLAAALPEGATWTAFAPHFAGTADGRVVRLGAVGVHTAPGTVLRLEERGEELRIGTSEGLYTLRGEGFVELEAPPAPLAYAGDLVLCADGRVFRWGEGLEATGAKVAPLATALLEVGEVTWVGTRGDGVHVHRFARGSHRRVTPTGQLCGNHVTAIARAGSRIVVGTFDRGVCWEEHGRWVRAHAPALPSDQVLGVAADGERLYVATTNGLGYFDGRRWTQVAFGGRHPLRLGRLSVLATRAEADGVWVMDGRGASLVARGTRLALHARTSPPERWAEHPSVATHAGSFLWYASEDRGLIRFDGSRWTRFHDGRDLTDNWVTSLDADAAGRLVAGTCQNGFNYFDGKAWSRVSSGLPSAMVTAVTLTSTGALIGTLGGLARYDASQGALTPVPGLADPRVSSLLGVDGALYVGTEGGLSVAPPSR